MVGKPLQGDSLLVSSAPGRQTLLLSEQAPATYFPRSYRGSRCEESSLTVNPANEPEEVRAPSTAMVLPRRIVGVGPPLAEVPAANPGRADRRVEQIAARTQYGVARSVLVRDQFSGWRRSRRKPRLPRRRCRDSHWRRSDSASELDRYRRRRTAGLSSIRPSR
jgi:hypothetical protein